MLGRVRVNVLTAVVAAGDMYTFSVQFVAETIHGACDCGTLRLVGSDPTPTLTDAGIDAPI
jgi:hypothetical protein